MQTVRAAFPASELEESSTKPDGSAYLRFRIPGRFELPDAVEFVVRALRCCVHCMCGVQCTYK